MNESIYIYIYIYTYILWVENKCSVSNLNATESYRLELLARTKIDVNMRWCWWGRLLTVVPYYFVMGFSIA
jgi:hypothetical protein